MEVKKNIVAAAKNGEIVGKIKAFSRETENGVSVEVAIIKTMTGQEIVRMKEYWMQIGMTYHERNTPTGRGAVIPF
jgi:hypothetical protein